MKRFCDVNFTWKVEECQQFRACPGHFTAQFFRDGTSAWHSDKLGKVALQFVLFAFDRAGGIGRDLAGKHKHAIHPELQVERQIFGAVLDPIGDITG